MRPALSVLVVSLVLLPALSSAAELLREGFADLADDARPSGWSVRSGEWGVLGGRLIGASLDGEARIELPVNAVDGVRVEASVEFLEAREPTRWAALSFGAADGGSPPYHSFTVRRDVSRSNGVEYAYRDGEGRWTVRDAGAAPEVLAAGRPARLVVEALGGRVRGWIDDQVVVDSTLRLETGEGRLALHVAGARVAFDDVLVRTLEESESEALAVSLGPVRAVPVIAHRGASAEAPENTVEAFRLGVEQGADGVEFDVYRSRDDRLVLFHDKTVERTSDFRSVFPNGKDAHVDALTLEELRSLDAGSWKDARWKGAKIPTLEEGLESLRGRSVPVVEIKPDEIGPQVAREIARLEMADEVFVQSFSARAIREFHETLPAVTTGWLTGDRAGADPVARARAHLRTAREAHASAIVCSWRCVHADYVREIQRHAMALWVYTVNDLALAERLLRLGVDGIITDVPDAVLALQGRGTRPGGLASGEPGEAIQPSGRIPGDQVVVVQRGDVRVLDLLRLLADLTDLPVLPLDGPQALEGQTVRVVRDVERADATIVRALLEANGWRLEDRVLPGGRQVIEVASAAERAKAGGELRPRPIIVVGEGTRASRETAERSSGEGDGSSGSDAEVAGRFEVAPVSEALRAQLGLPEGTGVVVLRADAEWLRKRRDLSVLRRLDVITHVDRARIGSARDLVEAIESVPEGEPYTLRIVRDGTARIERTRR